MNAFRYQAIETGGAPVQGVIEARIASPRSNCSVSAVVSRPTWKFVPRKHERRFPASTAPRLKRSGGAHRAQRHHRVHAGNERAAGRGDSDSARRSLNRSCLPVSLSVVQASLNARRMTLRVSGSNKWTLGNAWEDMGARELSSADWCSLASPNYRPTIGEP